MKFTFAIAALALPVLGCAHRPSGPSERAVTASEPPPVPESIAVSAAVTTSREGAAPSEASPEPAPVSSDPAVSAPRRYLPPARPCAIAVTSAPTDDGRECIELDRVAPERTPLSLCFPFEGAELRYHYDERDRILEAPGARYVYGARLSVTRTDGSGTTAMTLDASGRVTRIGADRIRYDDHGRILRAEGRGRFLAYVYAADDTYTTTHNYADTDEFCVADRTSVTLDAAGRVTTDVYDHCGINEIPRTLHYFYDADDRIERIEVDLRSDGTINAVLVLRYAC